MNQSFLSVGVRTFCVMCLTSVTLKGNIEGFGVNGAGWTLNGYNVAQGFEQAGPVASVQGNVLRITDVSSYWNARSAFFNNRQSITKFTASFTYQNLTGLGEGGGPFGGLYNPADGIVFTLQNEAPSAIGSFVGGGLGYQGISPATGVAFNIWNGYIVGIGYAPTSVGNGTYSYSSTSPVDLNSRHPINVTITYNGATLNVQLRDTVANTTFSTAFNVNLEAELGDDTAYVGFTGATGAGASSQRISNFSFGTLGEKAAALVKLAVGGVYVLGAKGWDWQVSRFVEPAAIVSSGYDYDWNVDNETVNGIDCSGLVFWSYNKAAGATKYQEKWEPQAPNLNGNIVQYASANGQYKHNTVNVSEPEPGDLLFFDHDSDDFMDHVAMYVGCCGPNENDVIQSSGPKYGDPGATWAKKSELISRGSFVAYGRITAPRIGLRFLTRSPVDLMVTDPDGFTITPETVILTEREILREIPGVLYYSVHGVDNNGFPESAVTAPTLKFGVYRIHVLPIPGALPTDTYSLDVEVPGATISLARGVRLDEIPESGYGLQASAAGLVPFIPASDVTDLLHLSRSGFRLNRATARFVQTLSFRNVAATTIIGPISVTFDQLTAGVRLYGANGSTAFVAPLGSPFIKLNVGADNALAPGEVATVVIEFVNPLKTGITYSVRALAGPGSL